MGKKCILLFSGGLDSLVAYYLLKAQKLEVSAVKFSTPFMKPEKDKIPEKVKVKEVQLGRDYLGIIRKPLYGTGKNINPCVDCRIFMLKKSKEIMLEEKAGFIVTGEVLGQRPMSQRKDVFNLADKKANLKGLVLRPLSARLLPETLPEQEGVVIRQKLLDIQGRSRRKQRELAELFGIKEYPNSAGGCLLTEREFSSRMKDLLNSKEEFSLKNANLLKIGRHFRITPDSKLIVARDKEESNSLFAMRKRYIIVKTEGFVHPCAVYTGNIKDALALCIDIFSFYAYKVSKLDRLNIEILSNGTILKKENKCLKKKLLQEAI